MRTFVILLCAAALTGCPGASQKISDKTGTTLAQRCAARTAATSVAKAQPEYGLQNESGARYRRVTEAYESYTMLVCPPPWGIAPPETPPPAPLTAQQ